MKYYYKYKKAQRINKKIITRFIGVGLMVGGFLVSAAVFLPVLSGIIFASTLQEMAMPIPSSTMVTSSTIQNFISRSVDSLTGFNSTDATQWFPNEKMGRAAAPVVSYTLSIPKLGITDANVSTVDTDLAKHLVNYGGTAIPPQKGTSIVLGHSTLPWLFDPKNYKAIFATLHTLKIGDVITVNVQDVVYTYKVYEMTVVDANDTSVFQQRYDNSYLILVTCSPPGTTWRRLLVKSRIEEIQ